MENCRFDQRLLGSTKNLCSYLKNFGDHWLDKISSKVDDCSSETNNSTGASDRSFYPIFNKRFGHLETLLKIHRPKNVLSSVSLYWPLV